MADEFNFDEKLLESYTSSMYGKKKKSENEDDKDDSNSNSANSIYLAYQQIQAQML